MATINPYLNFDGTCEEAFTFYKSIFGGAFSTLSHFKDMPGGEAGADAERVLHVSLPIGNAILMGSDRNSHMGPVTVGNNLHVSVNPESEDEAKRIFGGLASGGVSPCPSRKPSGTLPSAC